MASWHFCQACCSLGWTALELVGGDPWVSISFLGPIFTPGPYPRGFFQADHWRGKSLPSHYLITKPGYMQVVGLGAGSHFGCARLIQPALKQGFRSPTCCSTFLPWNEGPYPATCYHPCCLFWCCSGHTRTWGHTGTLARIDPCLSELTSCVGWPVYAAWRKGEERGKRKWTVE